MTPKVAVSGEVANATSLDVGYEIDAWTGASIDVTTAATARIQEVRHEIDAAITKEHDDVRLNASYRYSTEPDYRSHGVVLGGTLGLADKNTSLGVDLLGSRDQVGRAGDPLFGQSLTSVGTRLSIAQLLDRKSLVELAWETTYLDGFQSSPYRWVAVGGDGTCASTAPFCVPENVPDDRFRHAAYLRGRRALGDWSAGLEYRFYLDSWDVRSHALQPDVAWQISPNTTLSLRYRYYTQDEASFYRPRYADLMTSNGYVTRDRKLSAFYSQELGTSALRRFELADGDRVIVAGARATLSQLTYLAFVGLEHVLAFELTAMLALELP